jgi:membrane-bound lytic murein transglycosylase A
MPSKTLGNTLGKTLASAAMAALLAGCVPQPAPPPPLPALTQASTADLPGWTADHLAELLPALTLQCRRLALLPVDTALGGAGIAKTYGGRAGNWADACAALRARPQDADPHAYFDAWFQPYRVVAPALATGYFEPILPGATRRGGIYQTPVLARPPDLVQGGKPDAMGRPGLGRDVGGNIVPYFTRAEIEAGAMQDAARPVAWLASPIDLFFAQIQGAARIQLADGGTLRLQFDGRNGRPYTPIGRILEDAHDLPAGQITMQTIRAWLDAHPDQARATMDRNESYVFFRAVPDADPALGPTGALGVSLTAGRSAAIDRRFVPLASPVFVATTIPDGRAWRHLVLAQDLGSAIQGQARIDIYLGAGPAAADWAGRMHQDATLWLLLPRPAAAAPPALMSPASVPATNRPASPGTAAALRPGVAPGAAALPSRASPAPG